MDRSFRACLEWKKALPPSTSLPVMAEIAGVNTASLGGCLHSLKTRARQADGFTRTAPSVVHQGGRVKHATGASSKIRGRDNITNGWKNWQN